MTALDLNCFVTYDMFVDVGDIKTQVSFPQVRDMHNAIISNKVKSIV
jgi:hypothetical protein